MFNRIKDGMYWDRAYKLVEGCTPVSEGCTRCWSARETHMRANNPNGKISSRNKKLTTASGAFNGHIQLREDNISLPLHVKKPTAFAIWNDLFHKDVPDDFLAHVFVNIKQSPEHLFFILTKRPERMAAWIHRWYGQFGSPVHKNVWLGTTVENDKHLSRIDELLKIENANLYLSIEPMLGGLDIWKYLPHNPRLFSERNNIKPFIDWVICGGESGPGARPMHPAWARSLRDQCQAAGVLFLFKQWGEWSPDNFEGYDSAVESGIEDVDPYVMVRVGKAAAGRMLDGVEYLEVPKVGGGDSGS